jgi:hypothetical protein
MANTPRPSLLPSLNQLYDRLADIEIERAETQKLLRLALDRHYRETDTPATKQRLAEIAASVQHRHRRKGGGDA